jgi:hypothetical protein
MPRRFGRTKRSRMKKAKTYKRHKSQRGGMYTGIFRLVCSAPGGGVEECASMTDTMDSAPLEHVYRIIRSTLERNKDKPNLLGLNANLNMEGPTKIYLYNCESRSWLINTETRSIQGFKAFAVTQDDYNNYNMGFIIGPENTIYTIKVTNYLYMYISDRPPDASTPVSTFCLAPASAPALAPPVYVPPAPAPAPVPPAPVPVAKAPVYPYVPPYMYPYNAQTNTMEGHFGKILQPKKATYAPPENLNPAGGIGGPAPPPPEIVRYAISAHGSYVKGATFQVPAPIAIGFFTQHGKVLSCPNKQQTHVCKGTQDEAVAQTIQSRNYCKEYFLTPDRKGRAEGGFYSGVVECQTSSGRNEVILDLRTHNRGQGTHLSEVIDIIHRHHMAKHGGIPARVFGLFCRGDGDVVEVNPV